MNQVGEIFSPLSVHNLSQFKNANASEEEKNCWHIFLTCVPYSGTKVLKRPLITWN